MTTLTLRLRNTGKVAIHGKRPGEEFSIPVEADFVPADLLWRKRLRDEAIYHGGHLAIVGPVELLALGNDVFPGVPRIGAPAEAAPEAPVVEAPVSAQVEVSAKPAAVRRKSAASPSPSDPDATQKE